MVVRWADKWKISTVKKVLQDKVIVEWVRVVKKAVKKQWFVEKEMPIHISNVMIYDEKTKKPTRVGIRIENGKKFRYSKKSDEIILKSK